MEQLNVKFSHIDDLLQRIGSKLQINDTRYESAETSYKSVSKLLEEDDEFFGRFNLTIYPHGSFRLNTTVKPLKNDEYDLDFVLQVDYSLKNYDPVFVLNQLERCLKENGIYKDKISKHKRCIRINYENDFHMDIMPAYISENGGFIYIPDRELKSWVVSNPEGYAVWFEKQYLNNVQFLEKAARIEPLPDHKEYNILQPLQRSVQLIKRYRDITFQNENEKYLPKSIILSTLSAVNYNFCESESESITSVLTNVTNLIKNYEYYPFEIENPVLKNEKFTDKWFKDPEVYNRFVNFIENFKNDWIKMLNETDIIKRHKFLSNFFGETISKSAYSDQAIFIKSLKDSDRLYVDKKSEP